MSSKPATYEQFMDLIANVSPGRLQSQSQLIIDRFRKTQEIPSRFSPTTFFVDYTTRKYLYIDKTCLDVVGYPDIYYYEKGHEGFLKQTHPLDYDIVNTKIFSVNLDYLKNIPGERYPDIVFSHNFRLKDTTERFRVIVQRYSYVPGEVASKPIGVIGVAFDITHFKNDLSIVHTIEETSLYDNELVNKLIYKKTYALLEAVLQKNLGKREIQVLKLLSEGLNSKQIADKLKISINTVNNHRKNMLQKTGCKSSPEMLNFAIKHGLL